MIGAKKSNPKLRIIRGATKETKITEQAYFRTLEKAIDDIYEYACDELDWSWAELARESQLAYETVSRLGNRVTQWPRFFTIFKLARAVGWKLKLHGRGIDKAVELKKVG